MRRNRYKIDIKSRNYMEQMRDMKESEKYQYYRKQFFPLPPYQFSIEARRQMEIFKIDQDKLPYQIFDISFKHIMSPDINETLRIIEIEQDLIPLIESTDNKIFYRPLFFPTIFINNEFKFDDITIKGITILDLPHAPQGICIKGEIEDYLILYFKAREDRIEFSWEFILLSKKISSKNEKLADYIRLIICNMIDMVEGNDEDLEVTTIHTTKEQNIKRIKRGQVAFPTKVFIRPKKEFKQYVNDFKQADEEYKKSMLSYKFLVRGHWRHFRAERFIRKRGEKTWIKPFYKGQGIIVSKEYKLIK